MHMLGYVCTLLGICVHIVGNMCAHARICVHMLGYVCTSWRRHRDNGQLEGDTRRGVVNPFFLLISSFLNMSDLLCNNVVQRILVPSVALIGVPFHPGASFSHSS